MAANRLLAVVTEPISDDLRSSPLIHSPAQRLSISFIDDDEVQGATT